VVEPGPWGVTNSLHWVIHAPLVLFAARGDGAESADGCLARTLLSRFSGSLGSRV